MRKRARTARCAGRRSVERCAVAAFAKRAESPFVKRVGSTFRARLSKVALLQPSPSALGLFRFPCKVVESCAVAAFAKRAGSPLDCCTEGVTVKQPVVLSNSDGVNISD